MDKAQSEAYDRGAVDALRIVARLYKGRVIWPGDLLDLANEWEEENKQ